MISRTLSSRLLLAAAVLALPFTGGGCGRTACFTWSTQEGACPAQSEALAFFSNPLCPGQITAVDSEPVNEYDGKLCCYQVTAREQTDEGLCQGFGGSSSGGQGFGGSSSSPVSTGVGQGGFGGASTTGQGGGTTCARCGEEIGTTSPALLCDGSAELFKELIDCACSGACGAVCADNFCAGNPASSDCAVCLQDASLGCGNQLTACANDV
jgi:hypothetical protein